MESKVTGSITPATAIILLITSIVTILQFIFPEILTALRRAPNVFADGEWWRMITPLFVHADGWLQFIVNMFYLVLIGTVVERQCGSMYFLIFYFIGGIAGEIAGYASWDLYGAGASVGVFGVIGALYVMMQSRQMEVGLLPLIALLGYIPSLLVLVVDQTWATVGIILLFMVAYILIFQRRDPLLLKQIVIWTGLLGSVLLVLLQDIHGVSVFAGAMAFLVLNRRNKNTRQI